MLHHDHSHCPANVSVVDRGPLWCDRREEEDPAWYCSAAIVGCCKAKKAPVHETVISADNCQFVRKVSQLEDVFPSE